MTFKMFRKAETEIRKFQTYYTNLLYTHPND